MPSSRDSRPGPDKVEDESWIPNDLYQQAVQLYEAKYAKEQQHYLDPTACSSHVKHLQVLGETPCSLHFANDPMMPGFVKPRLSEEGFCPYRIGRVQLRQLQSDQWVDVALVVNHGDADCNSGFWGAAYLVHDNKLTTPLAWIRSTGDTVTQVNQAQDIPDYFVDEEEDVELEFHDIESCLDHDDDPEDLFLENLKPGLCTTPLEKLVGVAMGQMMHSDCKEMIKIPMPTKHKNKNDDGEPAKKRVKEH